MGIFEFFLLLRVQKYEKILVYLSKLVTTNIYHYKSWIIFYLFLTDLNLFTKIYVKISMMPLKTSVSNEGLKNNN